MNMSGPVFPLVLLLPSGQPEKEVFKKPWATLEQSPLNGGVQIPTAPHSGYPLSLLC